MITENIQKQFDTIQKTNQTVIYLLNSLDAVYKGLNIQFNNVQETSATIQKMLNNINDITNKIKNTTEYTAELREIIKKGEKAVLSSSKSIKEIKTVSENTNKIIDVVSNLAEQTNILAYSF